MTPYKDKRVTEDNEGSLCCLQISLAASHSSIICQKKKQRKDPCSPFLTPHLFAIISVDAARWVMLFTAWPTLCSLLFDLLFFPPVGQKQFVFVHVFGVCLLYVLKYTDVEGRVCEKDFSLSLRQVLWSYLVFIYLFHSLTLSDLCNYGNPVQHSRLSRVY